MDDIIDIVSKISKENNINQISILKQKLNSRDHISYAIMKFEPNSKHLTVDEKFGSQF